MHDWLNAGTPAAAAALAGQIDQLALQDMPSVLLGVYFPQTAYRASLAGVLDGSVRYPWNVHRA